MLYDGRFNLYAALTKKYQELGQFKTGKVIDLYILKFSC
jgi:hypothetical protein